MSVYLNPKTKKWYCVFRFSDWNGVRIQKKKSGFRRKADAQAFEDEFKKKAAASCDMLFSSFYDLYMESCKKRLKTTTYENKKTLIESKILPSFKNIPLNEITPAVVRKWQDGLLDYRDPKTGKPYAETYLKTINNQVSAMFNYAMRFYALPSNPAAVCGSIGKSNAGEMLFWTEEEFKQFIASVDQPTPYCMFNILFYTGIREGELLALTLSDFDFENNKIYIRKSYARLKKMDLINVPKTERSKRSFTVPSFLCEIVKDYSSRLMDYDPEDRLFDVTKSYLYSAMNRYIKKSGVKKIRVHDLRHSCASLLIKMGFQIKVIADILGHKRIQTTLQTYGHLYPDVKESVAASLETLAGPSTPPTGWKKE